jgi:serine/threonine protein phosphatase PrpC
MSSSHGRDGPPRDASFPISNDTEFQPLSALVRVDIAARSARGRTRTVNEDHFLVVRLTRQQATLETSLSPSDLPATFEESGYAMLVADGLGGTGRGAMAGRIALSTVAHMALHFGKWNVRVDAETLPEMLHRAEWYTRQADQAVYLHGRHEAALTGMAATLTAAYSAGDDLFVAHVGHSRAYLFRDGVLKLLTQDQTLDLNDRRGTAAVADRAFRDLQHVLTDAIGMRVDGALVEVEHCRLRDGDCVLLCTNGITDVVGEDQITAVLAVRRSIREQCCELVEMAQRLGSEDNATIVGAEYRIPASRQRPPLP